MQIFHVGVNVVQVRYSLNQETHRLMEIAQTSEIDAHGTRTEAGPTRGICQISSTHKNVLG